MIEEFQQTLSRFVAEWADEADEQGRALVIDESGITDSDITDLVDQIVAISEYSQTGQLKFTIHGDSGDSYEIKSNPHEERIHSEQTAGEGYDPASIYGDREPLLAAFAEIRNNTIDTIEELETILLRVYDEGGVEIDLSYRLQKTYISDALATELNLNETRLLVYFFESNFRSKFGHLEPAELRGELLRAGHHRSVTAILDLDAYAFGQAFGICGFTELAELPDAVLERPRWVSDEEEIRRNSLIEQQSETFLPPSFFEIDRTSDSKFAESVRELVQPYVGVFAILALSNSAEQLDTGGWRVRLKGRQFVEGELWLSSARDICVSDEEGDQEIEVDPDVIGALVSLYDWTFQGQVAERITVVRNVATLYARNLGEVITGAKTINQSARSNRQYYLEQSVEEFLEFRHELTDSAFQVHREFSDIRSQLMSDLSRDIFRTVGFVIALSFSVMFRIDNLAPPTIVYSALGVLIAGYSTVTLHRVWGIKRQFRTLIRNQSNVVEYYQRFFDQSELDDLGIGRDQRVPWYYRPFTLRYGEDDDYVRFRGEFRLDLFLYYMLIGALFLLGVGLLVDIHIVDLVEYIPVQSTN